MTPVSIGELMAALNTAAMVIGYIVLTLLLAGFFWLVSVWHESWLYRRRRKRRHDLEWDNVRSKWLLEQLAEHHIDIVEHPVIRKTTDVLDITAEDITNYSRETYRDAS